MRTKIIFVVLFMLSFSVAHDTVINIIQPHEHTATFHYDDQNIQSQECDSIDEVHAMFHFEALVSSYSDDFIQPPTKKTLSYNSSTYTFKYKETSDKPPKA